MQKQNIEVWYRNSHKKVKNLNLKTAARWIAHCGSHLKQETKKHENWENSQSFKRMDVILFKVYILDPVITLASYGKAQVKLPCGHCLPS